MTTITVGSNNFKVIEEIKQLLRNKFGNEVFIDEEKQLKREKGKWADFAEKMDGIFTPDIVKHIDNSRKEARDNFIVNN